MLAEAQVRRVMDLRRRSLSGAFSGAHILFPTKLIISSFHSSQIQGRWRRWSWGRQRWWFIGRCRRSGRSVVLSFPISLFLSVSVFNSSFVSVKPFASSSSVISSWQLPSSHPFSARGNAA